METLIEIKNVTKTFENKKVLNDISFTINKGEIFGIIGQSGAGKTVFLKALIGFYKPDSGDILFEGKSVFKHQKDILKTIGFASQRHSIYPDLSLKENLKYFGRLYGMKSKDIKESTKKSWSLLSLLITRINWQESSQAECKGALTLPAHWCIHPRFLY